ncbi:MAG: efflux RND transporter periplasmic adaptor subunit [Stappiaceae bacterium]
MRILPVIVACAVLAGGTVGYFYWQKVTAEATPTGFYRVNGRMEVQKVDISTKYAGRVNEINVDEGDTVKLGEVLVQMDVNELEAQLAAGQAGVEQASGNITKSEAQVEIEKANLTLAQVQLDRSKELLKNDNTPQSTVDQREAQRDVYAASVKSAEAQVGLSKASKLQAEADTRQVQVQIDEMTLDSPINGRVEYRLVQPGEVLSAGGRILTVLDLSNTYMTLFLPTDYVGRVAFGDEARIVLDAAQGYVIPATISFVSGDAQFTPKYVETTSERQTLMFRLKLQVPKDLLQKYANFVKPGMTGDGYVRIDPDAKWPESLKVKLPDVN